MEYEPEKIEQKWLKKWEKTGAPKAIDFDKNQKFYALVEFPYPSGEGLHVGHAFCFNLMDIFARKKRMEGKNALYPMGWDAFGLPTENYAIKTGIHPAKVTKKSTDKFREQMKHLGFAYNWDREVNTTNPEYYKWTQWIFIQLFKHGLAYKKQMKINWCPDCKIGLANEEVVDGKCERCGAQASQKMLSQWLLRITKYADRLADELDLVDFPESVKAAQRNWIGRSQGVIIKFPIKDQEESIPVFTTRPDTLFGATFFVLAPEHEIVDKITTDKQKRAVQKYVKKAKAKSELERISAQDTKVKTGVFTGSYVLNPLSNNKIPVYVADFVVMSYGTGAIMGVPGHDQRDWDFAKQHNLEIREAISGGDIKKQAYNGPGKLVNSESFNGLDWEAAKEKIFLGLEKKELAEKSIQYHIRDWIFSRQHYWGEPIPMIYCEKCGWQPVPEKDLPVKLPEVEKYEPTGTGESPLADIKDWVEIACPKCGKAAKRETDTMPNWAGSSWYFLRYCEPRNIKALASKKKLDYWMPVDVYLGGAEHTTLHLLYSRFWHKFLNDIGMAPGKEPYQKRRVHGVILGEDGHRMSKSRGNVINPEQMIEKFGVDALRTYLAFIGPYNGVFSWNTAGIKGTKRFCQRFWNFVYNQLEHNYEKSNEKVKVLVNGLIKDAGKDIDNFKFNTAVAKFMKFLNEVEKSEICASDLKKVLIILAPFAPYLTEELWEQIGEKFSIHNQLWPEYDLALLKQEKIILIVQINGKVRGKISTRPGSAEKEMRELALSSEKIQKWLKSAEIKKTIFIQDKLINFVI